MSLDEEELKKEINLSISKFYTDRLVRIRDDLDLKELLRRANPYLAKAKGIKTGVDLVKSIVDANTSSSDETLFGHVFEHIALYIVSVLYLGARSHEEGIDYEFEKELIKYLIQHKSGWDWHNDSQWKKLVQYFDSAKAKYPDAKCLNLCSYGRHKPSIKDNYVKMTGKDTWELLTGDSEFYIKLINLIDPGPQTYDLFLQEYNKTISLFLDQLKEMKFCKNNGDIDWEAWVKFNSNINSPQPKKAKKPQ